MKTTHLLLNPKAKFGIKTASSSEVLNERISEKAREFQFSSPICTFSITDIYYNFRYRCPTLVESYSASPYDPKSKKAKIDPGLKKGYHWLLDYIVKRYGDINLRVQTDIHAELERRRRMLSKSSNRASQTFIAESDEIATQTGFENPNFGMQKTEIQNNLDTGVIIVKPIKPNSIDSTITIESVENDTTIETDTSNVKPKLSPLFGRASNSTVESVKIELEPRNEFRKLSPIVRKKGVNHIDFKNRPQSSPTYRNKVIIKEQPFCFQFFLSFIWNWPNFGPSVKNRATEYPIMTFLLLTFRRILEELRVRESGGTQPHFAWLPERGNGNIKYLIPPSGQRTHNVAETVAVFILLRM